MTKEEFQKKIFDFIEKGNLDGVKIMISKDTIEIKNKYGFTPLLWALKENYMDIASWLLTLGANSNAVANGGQNALMWAVRHDNINMVKNLIECGYDLNKKEIDEESDEEYYVLEIVLNHWLGDGFKREMFSLLHSYENKMDAGAKKVFKKIRLYKTVN